MSIIVCFCNLLKTGKLCKIFWISMFFRNLLRIVQIFFGWDKEMGVYKFRVFWNKTHNRNKMAPCPRIFTIKVPKHKMHRENVCFHDTFKFYDCSFYRFLAIHNRVNFIVNLVKNSLQGEEEISWGLPGPCCPRV